MCAKVHQLLHHPPPEEQEAGEPGEDEVDSVHSGDDSNTDSGKGPSEDGEKGHRVHSHVTPTARQSAALHRPSKGERPIIDYIVCEL